MESYPLDRCPKCGTPRKSAAAIYCSKCGSTLRVSYPGANAFGLPVGRGALVWGVVLAVSGLASYLWAGAHSPHMGLGEIISASAMDENAYFIKEPLYSAIVILAAFLGLAGVVLIVRELIREAKG